MSYPTPSISVEEGKEPFYTVKVVDNTDELAVSKTGDSGDNVVVPETTTILQIPALCFGLYKVPNDDEGEQIVVDAISNAGYRSLDSASIYGNEETVGRALAKVFATGVVERSDLFLASKVWNDAQRHGRSAVRESVVQSLRDLQCNNYLDICYVHWPVTGHYVETYRELQLLQAEGKIRHLGISNFTVQEYQHLMSSEGVHVKPLMNQLEISPYMYRPQLLRYFQQEQGILLAASKALHRATELDQDGSPVKAIANRHSVSCAQVMLRWSLQKGFLPLSKTSHLERMRTNRNVFDFALSIDEMGILDSMTDEDTITSRAQRELESKQF